MNSIVMLNLVSAALFSAAAVVLIRRRKNTGLKAGTFIPLLLSIVLYDFIVASNILEHLEITDYLDSSEDLAEVLFTLVFLFFINNWRKDRSESRFRELFKLAPMSLAEIANDGRIMEVNDRLVKKLKEYFGITIDDTPTLGNWWDMAYPDAAYRKWITAEWHKTLELAGTSSAEIDPLETEITCRDGSKRTMIVDTSGIGENLLLSMVDITDRKLEEAARMENLELLRATFNATPDGILVWNQELKVTHANQQFFRMWQVPQTLQNLADDEALKKWVRHQLAEPLVFQNMVDRLLHSRIRDVFEIALKDGRVFDCHTAPMMLHGNEIGRVWDFRDITMQKQAEAERERLQRELYQSQKLEAIGILAGGVAHDFNNMLGTIMGYAELVGQGMAPDDPLRDSVAKILEATHRSAGLIRQLLIFARKQAPTLMAIDVNSAVKTMLKMLQRLIGENIELSWQPAESPCTVKMDPSQLDQILVNLCVNAREAIEDVGRITINTARVFIDEAASKAHADCFPGNYVRLSVLDNGTGMDRETADRVFEPFFTTKGVGRGTGLGLSTVYGIVKQSQGFIHLCSEPGIGTTFNIHIPFHAAEKAPEQIQTVETIPHSQGETILMVEDDRMFAEMIRTMLERLGYEVLIAITPKEAIELAEKKTGKIDLILSDVVMPEMNGRELMDRLLSIRPDAKHLFMSGYTADVIIHRGVSDEEEHFIQKPFTPDEIAAKLRSVLEANT